MHTHTTVLQPLFWDPGEPVPEEIFIWTFMVQVQGKITEGRHTDHLAGRHSIQTTQLPTSVFPTILRRMPFLPQPSHFILDVPNMLACIPSGVVYSKIQ